MPELPEVETVRRRLEPALVGAMITSVRVARPGVVTRFGPEALSPRRRAGHRPRVYRRDLLQQATVARLDRHGKQLAFISTDDRVMVVHLGMTGQLLLAAPSERVQSKHVHIAWRLEDGTRLLFRDPRRFGGVLAGLYERDLHEHVWSRLGQDALTISASRLRAALACSHRPVKAALLDQGVIAGVGNIYADEACFRAGLHPATPCADVPDDLVVRLARSLRSVLRAAIKAKGSTLRDYRQPDGAAGSAQLRHLVYGRAGDSCRACESLLVGTTVAQRTTVFCPRCQSSPELFTKRATSFRMRSSRISSTGRELITSS